MSTVIPVEPEVLMAETQRRMKAATADHKRPVTPADLDVEARIARLSAWFKKRQPESNRHEQEARRRNAASLLTQAGCPERHLRCQPDFTAPGWSERFGDLKQRLGRGFLVALVGQRGPGKTQLAVELIRETASRLNVARYVKALSFFMALRETYSRESGRSERQVLVEFTRPKFLVIDECHERGETPWEDRLLTHLLDLRYDSLKDTLIISNQTQQEFETTFGSSLLSRMNETGGLIVCDWKSFR